MAHVTAKSIAAIGSIKSLEQPCLGAGVINDWRHQWLIDRNELRLGLRSPKELKRLLSDALDANASDR
ncbi:hypothetical protein PT974_11007 [Cladobotryum mycophilum]|uniref:Uncharacterized protein n=1 Tax=Cladobotryum mycophilum TaxID=491253 RepID=A0ABR0SBF5_9HYPO